MRPFDISSQSAVLFRVPPVNPTIPKKGAICAFYGINAPLQKLNDKPKTTKPSSVEGGFVVIATNEQLRALATEREAGDAEEE